jgi:RimJ/RimL family protein N-acetyltransferase
VIRSASRLLADRIFGLYRAFLEGRLRVLGNQLGAEQVLTKRIGQRLALVGVYFDLFYAPFRFYSGTTVSDEGWEDDVRESKGGWEEHRTLLALTDGTCVSVRKIRPEDAPALQRLVDRSSERTIRLRYFGPMKHLSDEMARRFAEVDGKDRCALVALDPEDEEEIIAVVRYDREGDTNRAEYAALVEDRFQSLGLGHSLTRALIQAARERGIGDFEALVLPENKGMIRLLRSLDLPEREWTEDRIKHFSLDLFPERASVSSDGH